MQPKPKQGSSSTIYPPILNSGELVRKLKTINNIISTLFYSVHIHFDNFLNEIPEDPNNSIVDNLEKVFLALSKRITNFLDDIEQLIKNVINAMREISEFMDKYWPKDPVKLSQTFHEGDKWRNQSGIINKFKDSTKALANITKIYYISKNASLCSKLLQLYEKRDKRPLLVIIFFNRRI